MQSIFPIIFPIFMILTIGVIIFMYSYKIKEHTEIMKRARKIDPTVKTRAEAEYVLKKDIAQSVGKENINK